MAAGSRLYPNRTRLLPETGTVIQRQSRLYLPLVHHLVQNGVLYLFPRFLPDMRTADRDRDRLPGTHVYAVFAQPGLHSPGEPKRNLPELPLKILVVEPGMGLPEIIEYSEVAWLGALGLPRTWCPLRRMQLDGEREKLVFQRLAQPPGHPGLEEPHNRVEHPVRRHGISSMNTERTVTPGKHDGTIGVHLEMAEAGEPQRLQPPAEQYLSSVGKSGGPGTRPYHRTRTR